jgi:putative ABC transport system substrate-binding protein
MARKTVIVVWLVALTLASVRFAEAQQLAKVSRIGFLSALSPEGVPTWLEAFRQGLRELGYVEGKNIVLEWRFAEGKLNLLPSPCGGASESQGRCNRLGWPGSDPSC